MSKTLSGGPLGWDGEKKAKKLSTLLEGEALAAWTELTEDEKKDFDAAKARLIKKLSPLEFVTLEQFQKCAIFPGESVGMYLYELKRLLRQAMPELSEDASRQLLINQFLNGLPAPVSRQLQAVGNTTNLEQFVERAKVLMVVDDNSREVAAVQLETSELPKLKTQIQELTAQVAALTTQKSTKKPYNVSIVSRQATFNDTVPIESENGSVIIVASWVILLQTAGSRETRLGCT